MKTKKTFVCCEYCNKPYEDISPPDATQYKQGFIKIGNFSTILLDNLKKSKGHSFELQGVYCNMECLIKQMKKVRTK